MDLKIFFGIILGIALVAGVSIAVPVGDSAIPSTPPPTPAFSQMTIVYDNNVTISTDDNINATTYRDNLVIISDGSILASFTNYTLP